MISYTGGVHVFLYVGVVSRFNCMYPDISKVCTFSIPLSSSSAAFLNYSSVGGNEIACMACLPRGPFSFFARICWIINKRLPIGTH